MCLNFVRKTAKLISRVAVPFSVPTPKVGGFHELLFRPQVLMPEWLSSLKRGLRIYPFPLYPFSLVFQTLLLGPLSYFYLSPSVLHCCLSFFFFLLRTYHGVLPSVGAKFASDLVGIKQIKLISRVMSALCGTSVQG